ncbi:MULTISPECIES: NADH-quinone oxidoreductase subunit C [Kordiimonas]|uniref:NADH-quinone oxidoreductase subunit C n=1 Tax=Kordiimonas TaxID=288021 RepID=UPI001FF2C086|nr:MULTISPECIES: NADH-quinone oxidoreductase subunit C [Kordiimonas]MCK0070988.1 NADH-quinone oxidoreductase subunit C [Kordiimonas laminariae]UTW57507.1 NADH-quinone oxidoreductase subunit C [Kordiimonas sp. SCSIO 12603]
MTDKALIDLGEAIATSLENDVISTSVSFGELTITVRADHIKKVLTYLRDNPDCCFKQLIDLTAVDYPERSKRFDVVYHLLSIQFNQRIRVKVETDEDTPVPSAVEVYPAANWFEREAWDMYGIFFSDHPDLRRMLSDYGFQGFPLRKDFPVMGYVECRYSEEEGRVIYEPTQLTQENRNFDFMSPWETAKYVLPGDEKAEAEKK